MADPANDIIELATTALSDKDALDELLNTLSGGSRRDRQRAASALSYIGKTDASKLVEHASVFVDALNRPEAQTRWESLEVLTQLVDLDSRKCEKGIDGAEAALFDEESGPVRLSAVRFLCKIGATTTKRSQKVWPLLDEAIQCYHGDLEFNDMLIALVDFSAGKLDKEVKAALVDRMSFDATNSKGTLKRRAEQIVANAS